MNSALQCLAHTEGLIDYFLRKSLSFVDQVYTLFLAAGLYQSERNLEDSPDMQGAIAKVFGLLLRRIWAKGSIHATYSPREFKSQLQRFAPQFSDNHRHDSQEFMAFLLDGLNEDLNRVYEKPHVEKLDWHGRGDLELARLAQQSWQGYMRWNDSIIVDLFQGQYQSTLECPKCSKVSSLRQLLRCPDGQYRFRSPSIPLCISPCLSRLRRNGHTLSILCHGIF